MNTSIIPMTKFLNIPVTLDRMLHLICYHWEICSEVEEIITKLVFWGDWRPSLVECPRLNFANICDTKSKHLAIYLALHWQVRSIQGREINLEYPSWVAYPPETTVCLGKISIYSENLTKRDILEIKNII